jgi:cobalt/nickel transport system ATP-binding protein
VVTPVFALDRVSYSYPDGRLGLSEATLSIPPGESLIVLGANASGKSTLLRLLAGLALATSGTVQAFGETLTERRLEEARLAADFRRRAGAVPGHGVMLSQPDGVRRDRLAAATRTLGRAVRAVNDMLDLLGLQSVAQSPHALSGGERRKVAFRALPPLRRRCFSSMNPPPPSTRASSAGSSNWRWSCGRWGRRW